MINSDETNLTENNSVNINAANPGQKNAEIVGPSAEAEGKRGEQGTLDNKRGSNEV